MGRRPFAGLARLSFVAGVSLVAAAAGASAMGSAGGTASRAQRGSVRLDGSPSFSAANPRTHTLYMPIHARATRVVRGSQRGIS